jgi:hypothetical protein
MHHCLANMFHPLFTNVTMHQEGNFIFQEDELPVIQVVIEVF